MKRILIFIGLLLFFGASAVHADPKDDFTDSLTARQQTVTAAFDDLETRVDSIHPDDPKKDKVDDLLEEAETAVDAFRGLEAADHVLGEDPPFEADEPFLEAERDALGALNAVNRQILAPVRPGEGQEGSVPEGDLVEDFIPQFVRLLFQFTSIAILISIVVAALFLITALDNEEQQTKAKKMLLYSLIGFAFVVLAYALVQAITDIDFFGTT